MIHRRSLLGGAIAAIATPAAAFDPKGLREDARILRTAYEAMHPGLYRYNTPAQMAQRFAAFERDFGGAGDRDRAFLALSRLTAAVRCGHTYPNPLNHSDALQANMFSGQDRLPFAFQWIGGEMVVTASLEPTLPVGTRVTAVQGEPTAPLLARLVEFARADGANDAKRVANMEITGLDRFAAFDVYRPMLQGGTGGSLRLTAAAPGGPERALEVAAVGEGALTRRATEGEPWRFEVRRDGVAVLTMTDWALYDSPFPWKAWLEARLDELAGSRARGLVVDLRDNEGGLDCGDPLLARLARRDLPMPAYGRFTRYRAAPAELKPFLSTWDRSFLDWGAEAVGPDAEGFYRMTRYDEVEPEFIRPAGKPFRGRLAVLVGAANSSATFQFALTVRNAGLGRLVGQPTGGNLRGINGGAFFFLKLPHSGLEADLPLIATLPRTPQPDRGLVPDIPVRRSAAAIAAGRDQEMAAAVRWILD